MELQGGKGQITRLRMASKKRPNLECAEIGSRFAFALPSWTMSLICHVPIYMSTMRSRMNRAMMVLFRPASSPQSSTYVINTGD